RRGTEFPECRHGRTTLTESRTWKRRTTGRRCCWKGSHVPEPEFLNYRPKWAELYSSDEPAEEAPFAGVPVVLRPQLVTRILPKEGRDTLSAPSLTEIINATQRGVQFAACDEVYGWNPDYADLRTAGPEVTKLTRLEYRPESFQEGSFVIEA